VLVDDTAAGEVHEEGGLLHQREQALAHQVTRFRAERAMQRDEVGFAEELVESDRAAAEGGHVRGRDVRVADQQRHVEGACAQRHARRDDTPYATACRPPGPGYATGRLDTAPEI